ncbi:hypothetical protein [Paenibacillus hexagrammi]|uniref:Uncharacterized protein n=1 Tax=Paenibacillus hexagrammi TaxID=2908839 RepID=A0ABY3SJC8_9BACL|nr:hypothetical protein [Paenibacillus sp. YPD9-1]UJF33339.1 hypothetical protein L0M14_28140 [Paenibacillus sp. YPD9-1]
MTGFRGMRYVKDLMQRFKIKRESLTGNESDKQQQEEQVTTTTTLAVMKRHKWALAIGAGTLVLAGAVTVAGHEYVQAGMAEIYHVQLNGNEIGIVSDNKLIDEYKQSRPLEVQKNFPNVHVELDTSGIVSVAEKAFRAKTDDASVIARLNELLVPQPTGVELKVDNKVVAIVKDQQTADEILAKIKSPYTDKTKDSSKVTVLSAGASDDISTAPSELVDAEFVQDVETAEVPIDPSQLGRSR